MKNMELKHKSEGEFSFVRRVKFYAHRMKCQSWLKDFLKNCIKLNIVNVQELFPFTEESFRWLYQKQISYEELGLSTYIFIAAVKSQQFNDFTQFWSIQGQLGQPFIVLLLSVWNMRKYHTHILYIIIQAWSSQNITAFDYRWGYNIKNYINAS